MAHSVRLWCWIVRVRADPVRLKNGRKYIHPGHSADPEANPTFYRLICWWHGSLERLLGRSSPTHWAISSDCPRLGLNLTLKISKCSFAKSQITFVGHLVGSGTIRPDPAKVATVQDLKPPTTKREVKRLIGFFSYFRAFIPSFAQTAKVLTDLTRKDVPNNIPWDPKHQEAFDKLNCYTSSSWRQDRSCCRGTWPVITSRRRDYSQSALCCLKFSAATTASWRL